MNHLSAGYAFEQEQQINVEGYKNLVDVFDYIVAEKGDALAFSALGHSVTFNQVELMSRQLAYHLQNNLGLNPGDRIAIQLPNLVQYPIAAWAAWRAGLIVVNTNPMYTIPELTHQFNDAGVKAAIVLADLLPVLAAVKDQTSVQHIIATNATDMIQAQAVTSEHGDNVQSWSAIFNDENNKTFRPSTATMHDNAALQYTGGTTGVSKGAELTHSNFYCAIRLGRTAFATQEKLRGSRQELTISPMPLYHVYGFTLNVVSVFITGGHSVLIPDPRNVASLIGEMNAHEFTGFAGVNTLFSALLDHPDFSSVNFDHLDTTIAGGAALADEIALRWKKVTGKEIYEGYGLTETAATATVNRCDDVVIGSVGHIYPQMEFKLIDEAGTEVGKGEEGELCLRGPNIMKGYWQRPEATAESIDQDGWFRTGDVAVQLEGGHIKIVDRIKDMILVSGFNVYPNEIENIVYSFPGVSECAAIGVKDERSGEAVKLFLVCSNKDATKEQVIDHCRQHLTAYKVPKQIEFREDLPKSNVGKILRRALRD